MPKLRGGNVQGITDINIRQIEERRKKYASIGLDWEKETDFLISLIKTTKKKALEIGTGKGFFTYNLTKVFEKIISVDIDKNTQHIANAFLTYKNADNKVAFISANAEKLPFKNSSFGYIASVDSLHHFKNPITVLKEILRVLSDHNGIFLLCDFNDKGFYKVDKMHSFENKIHHKNNFSVKDAAAFFRKQNIKAKLLESENHSIAVIEKNKR